MPQDHIMVVNGVLLMEVFNMSDNPIQINLIDYLKSELLKISDQPKWKYSVRIMSDRETVDAYSFFVANKIINLPEKAPINGFFN